MSERDKFLTEAMGECWHEPILYDFDTYKGYDECKICNQRIKYNNNFSTWEGFGKLWEWAQKQEWWDIFLTTYYWDEGSNWERFIHPDSFAALVYEYLKERREGEII